MFNSRVLFIIVLFFFCTIEGVQGQEIKQAVWKGQPIEYIDGEIAVKFKHTLSANDISRINGIVSGSVVDTLASLRWIVIKLPQGLDPLNAIGMIENDPSIEIAVPRTLMIPHSLIPIIPNDFYFASKQWYLRNTGQSGGTAGADIKAPEAWSITTGSSDVIMAILDSGIPLDTVKGRPLIHPDLDDARKIIVGPDVIYPYFCKTCPYRGLETDNKPNDEFGHGTHVAGLAGAETNNATGIAGVGWNCKILVIQVFGKNTAGELSGIAESFRDGVKYAVDYARAQGKRMVINFSGAFYKTYPYIEAAVA